MRRLLFLILFSSVTASGQGKFQPGHTHDILQVRFSPDATKLASYSWGDGWLCYWDVPGSRLLWKSKTGFIQKANEHANIDAFGWNDDASLLYTRSENGTFQTWDASTGKLLAVSEANPNEKAFARTKVTVRKDYLNFYLSNPDTGKEVAIKMLSRTGSGYDVSDNGNLFAEGGSWGNAAIRITEVKSPLKFRDLKGGKIPPYVPTELEANLNEARLRRQRELNAVRYERDQKAALETEGLQKLVYIAFEHYGDMKEPGSLRMIENSAPNQSKARKSAADANAVWLRLHNDSRLPIEIPTQSMYLPDRKCFHQFSGSIKVLGLCDGAEIAVWFGLEDKKGKPIPYGFDFGSSAILLPGHSVLFAVPVAVLNNGNAIRFDYTFQNVDSENKVSDYGTRKTLNFRRSVSP
jgi:hypothetical protein